jgi:hypothetical protein
MKKKNASTVRISVGLEDFQDLKNDLIQAFDKVIRVSDLIHLCMSEREIR